MRQADLEQVQGAPILASLYAPVRQELDEVEEVFRQTLRSDRPFIDGLIKYGFRLGGKRLRPALVLLTAKASGSIDRNHVLVAAAVEMIHTATLIHDDVLDEATLRRHLDTVNARWDNETSVLLGDYLLTQSLCLASSLDDPFACRSIGEASRAMCEGELCQIESRGDYALAESQYFEIIRGKTAALIACCCRLGAHYAGADAAVEHALDQYGLHLGIAFQIVDDLLDVLGDEAKVGKSLGTDLLKQKSTLPLIRLLDQSTPAQRAELLARLSGEENHRSEFLRGRWGGSDAIPYTRAKAVESTRLACGYLDALPPSPARDSLRDLTEFVVNRQH